MEELMNIFKVKYLLILLCLIPFDLNAQSSKSDLQQMYVSYLRREGYQPEIDSDGDILFKAEGSTLYIYVYENDPNYFRMVYPYFWSIESEEEMRRVAEIASYVTRTTKVVRVYMERDNEDTSIDVAILMDKPEDFKKHFSRLLTIIFQSRREFIDMMR
jgi:hypothetical protein